MLPQRAAGWLMTTCVRGGSPVPRGAGVRYTVSAACSALGIWDVCVCVLGDVWTEDISVLLICQKMK